MKGEHCEMCVIDAPTCKCNSCKKDKGSPICCCIIGHKRKCPIDDCPNFEPDDEGEGDE